jgi:hypothetical protein
MVRLKMNLGIYRVRFHFIVTVTTEIVITMNTATIKSTVTITVTIEVTELRFTRVTARFTVENWRFSQDLFTN